jgi:hypothetical protein
LSSHFLENVAVYVTGLAGATTWGWVAVVTPSDQDRNTCLPLRCWGVGALKEFFEPTMTVRENGAVALTPLKMSIRPVGFVANVNVVVLGSTP